MAIESAYVGELDPGGPAGSSPPSGSLHFEQAERVLSAWAAVWCGLRSHRLSGVRQNGGVPRLISGPGDFQTQTMELECLHRC